MLNFLDILSFIATIFGSHHVSLSKLNVQIYKIDVNNCSIIFDVENLNDDSVSCARDVKVIWRDDNGCENQSSFEVNESFVVRSFEKVFITLLTDGVVFSSIRKRGALFLFEIEDVGELEVYCDSLL